MGQALTWKRIDANNYQTTDTDECVRITAHRRTEYVRGKFGRGALRPVVRVRWDITIDGQRQTWELTLKAAKHRAGVKLDEYRKSRESEPLRTSATAGEYETGPV